MDRETNQMWRSVLNPTTSSGTKTREHDSGELVPQNQQQSVPFCHSSKGSTSNSVESEKLISSHDSKSSLIQDGHDY